MIYEYVMILISVIVVSLISVISVIPLLIKKNLSDNLMLFLLSLSVGTLLGAVFIHMMPEIIGSDYSLKSSLFIITGFIIFFFIEKLIHHHHSHGLRGGHSHAYHLAPINLIGDGIHNFIDGMIIAGSYLISIPLGISATVSVIFHEIPQEIADFGVLLYSGLSKKKALVFNFLSAATAILGAFTGVLLFDGISGFSSFIIPFAAGSFIYIAAASLVPELHRTHSFFKTVSQLMAMVLGVVIILSLAAL